MQSGNITTPFGRRRMTLAMLASQSKAQEIPDGKSVDKWKLYRWLCEARLTLGVTDRAMALLNALLSFHPHSELSEDTGLIVFPSNAQLSLRAHGMAEQTIRRHLAVLIDTGLLSRKDSANGKRFARRDGSGDIDDAFGFSLAPLLARSEEFEAIAAQVVAERVALQRLKERLTICRRDIAKLIMTALEEQAQGDWESINLHFRSLVTSIPRAPTALQVAKILDEMEMLREEVVNLLEMQLKTENPSGNAAQTERHIQNSNPDSIPESEPLFEKEQGQNRSKPASRQPVAPELKSFPLGMVLQACPQIADYGPSGAIASWRDLMGAAIVVRSMLGVSPSAYQEACEILGPENAATVMACVLERAGHINSAGGYLRSLTDRARKGEFALGPMLMALLRTNGGAEAKTG
uniref:plasmid replication protein RepC n=1 Tax=uncultured Rhizobium sp. TaxID=155567 RepID=UPI0026234468|nr:plasmid replication protein RepC [uncultured Rhizobium sp.]